MGCCFSALARSVARDLVEAYAAIRDDDAPRLARLLRGGPLLALANSAAAAKHSIVPPLAYAAVQGNAQVIHVLIGAGASPCADTWGGATPLMLAADAARPAAVRALLAAGADPNAQNSGAAPGQESGPLDMHRWSALHFAAARLRILSHVAALGGWLIAAGDCSQEEAMAAAAARAAQEDGVEGEELERRARVCVEALLRAGGDAAARTQYDLTPAHLAAVTGAHGALAALLAVPGIALLPRAASGHLPLHLACVKRQVACVVCLLEAAPEAAWARDEEGRLPIHLAVMGQGWEAALVVELLLEAAPSLLEEPAHGGARPLHLAACGGAAEATTALLRAGASPTARTERGSTPLTLAAQLGRNEAVVAALLEAAPGMATAVDANGNTPLHCAAAGGEGAPHLPTVRALLAGGPAAAAMRNKQRHLPIEAALRHAAAAGTDALRSACVQAACILARVGPVAPVQAALAAAGGVARPAYAGLVAGHVLTAEQWAHVPTPCAGLGAALPEVLQRSEPEAALLVAHLSAAERARLQAAALCLARAQRDLGIDLPAPLTQCVLAACV